jgi:hypothetical protein
MLKRNWALIALVYLAFAEILSLGPVPDLSLCLIQPEHQQTAHHDEAKYCPAFHVGIIASIDALDGLLERHDKSVVGAFTIVLAISTIGLWLATISLWKAGERQLELQSKTAAAQSRDMQDSIAVAHRSADIAEKALLSVEIPYLYPFTRRHGFTTSPSRLTGQLGVTGFDFGNEFIEYYFKNFGRTPAEITEVQSILFPSMGMPDPWPATDHNLNPLSGYITAADGGESPDFPYAFNRGMFDTYSQGRFNPDTHIFYFLGFVRYNDVFENEYIKGFCLRYAPMNNSFYPVGGDDYNYRRKIKAAGQET